MYQVYFLENMTCSTCSTLLLLYLCMTQHPIVHPLEGLISCETSQQPSPHSSFGFGFFKGGSLPLASDLQGVFFVFTMTPFSQPRMSKYCDFSSLFKGFMMHYCAKPLEQVWKVTSFTHSWLWIYRLN